jgi:hypothetical protein
MDVLAAVQAAWLAGDYVLARDLVQRYIDPSGDHCCMRCTAMEDEPWRVNTRHGSFFVCPPCTTELSKTGELMQGGGEVFMTGPKQVVRQTLNSERKRVEISISRQESVSLEVRSPKR